MKFKILLFTISLFTITNASFAASLIDSVGVKNNDGKKMVQFKVKAGDTYYSIGHRYNIKPETLMKFNGSKKQTLSIGAIVNVPTDQPFKKSKKETEAVAAKETKKDKKHKGLSEKSENAEQPENAAPERVEVQQPEQHTVQVQTQVQDNTPPTQYKVSAGETLYAISKRFNTTVDEITKLNNLPNTTVHPGQILLVKSSSAASVTTTTVTTQPTAQPQAQVQTAAPVQSQPQHPAQTATTQFAPPVAKRDSPNAQPLKDSSGADRHLNPNRFGLYEKNEKGVATWIDDPSLDPTKKLVLHRFAPIGTVIKITNPMTNRTTFAKVVGRFADSEATKDVIIVMTKNVADALGALDKRFHVYISYGSPNE